MKVTLSKIKTLNYFKAFAISSLMALGFPSFGQITEKNYKIYSVKTGKEVALNDIVEDMKNYDVLFFGEEHNDSVTHFLENKMFELLHAKYADKVALSMEMFDRDVQVVMNEYLKGDIREKNFNKDARVWSNYRDYKPMVEYAKKNKLDVVCANAASRYTNLAGRKGQKALMALPEDSKKYFAPLPYDTASGKYYEKLMGLSSHDPSPKNDTSKKAPAKMPPMGGYNLIMGQSLWDATMAYSISEYLKKNTGKKVMQVNGRFHSDEGFAVVTQLKKYSPKAKTLIISTGREDTFPTIEWSQFKEQGDYIIMTDPKVPSTYKE
ncbi:MAG: ChaN family lipoprotein [Bacteroidota bacterium]|nr:ChaN family lipoprotein [Bacteroidota bacterium]